MFLIIFCVNFDPANRRAEISLVILNDYRHQGYATATIHQIHDYARRILHLHQLYVCIDERNEASLSLFRKEGYISSVRIPDWLFPAYYDCRLVKLNNVQFAASDTSMTYAVEHGSATQNRNMTSCDGNTLVARNSDYADFAGQPLPKGSGSVVGIMTRYIRSGSNGTTTTTYQIIIRSTDEVNMENERCD